MSAQEECLRRGEEPPPVWWLPLWKGIARWCVARKRQFVSVWINCWLPGGISMKASCESQVAVFDFDVPPKTWPGSPASRAPLFKMSALGQKQTFAVQNNMSGLPPKADISSPW